MGPWPIGTVGAYSMDVNPYMQGLRIYQAEQARNDAMRERAGEFASQMGLQKAGMEADAKLATLRLLDEQDARSTGERVSMAGIRQRDLESQRSAEGAKAGLGLKERQYEDKLASEAQQREDAKAQEAASEAMKARRIEIVNGIRNAADAMRVQGMSPEEIRTELLLQMQAEAGADQEEMLFWRDEIERAVAGVPEPPKPEAPPEEDAGSQISPTTRLNHWKRINADAAEEVKELEGLVVASRSEDPDVRGFAEFELAQYGGLDGLEQRLIAARERLETSQGHIDALLTGEAPKEPEILPYDPANPAQMELLPHPGDIRQPGQGPPVIPNAPAPHFQ